MTLSAEVLATKPLCVEADSSNHNATYQGFFHFRAFRGMPMAASLASFSSSSLAVSGLTR